MSILPLLSRHHKLLRNRDSCRVSWTPRSLLSRNNRHRLFRLHGFRVFALRCQSLRQEYFLYPTVVCYRFDSRILRFGGSRCQTSGRPGELRRIQSLQTPIRHSFRYREMKETPRFVPVLRSFLYVLHLRIKMLFEEARLFLRSQSLKNETIPTVKYISYRIRFPMTRTIKRHIPVNRFRSYVHRIEREVANLYPVWIIFPIDCQSELIDRAFGAMRPIVFRWLQNTSCC